MPDAQDCVCARKTALFKHNGSTHKNTQGLHVPLPTHVACVFSVPAVATRTSALMQGANTATDSLSQHTECCRADSTHTLLARGSVSHLSAMQRHTYKRTPQRSTACMRLVQRWAVVPVWAAHDDWSPQQYKNIRSAQQLNTRHPYPSPPPPTHLPSVNIFLSGRATGQPSSASMWVRSPDRQRAMAASNRSAAGSHVSCVLHDEGNVAL